jgi:hypothetical protein
MGKTTRLPELSGMRAEQNRKNHHKTCAKLGQKI